MGKPITVEVWESDDGHRFDTQEEMLRYEGAVKFDSLIGTYLDEIRVGEGSATAVAKQAARATHANVLRGFLPWAEAKGHVSLK